jgi:predicted PurR-regulated permease PerM
LLSAPKWTPVAKRYVLIASIILILIAIWRFSIVLYPLVVAVIIAYLLNPLVNLLVRRTPCNRAAAATLSYIGFLVMLVLIPLLLSPIVVRQVSELDIDLVELYGMVHGLFGTAGVDIDTNAIAEQIQGGVNQFLSPVASVAANVAVNIAGVFIWFGFILVVGYYLLLDANRFMQWVDSWIPTAYSDEFKRLRIALDGVWKSYFVGQVTLAIIVGTLVGAVAAILGIRSAILLGLVAALLELIPNWGYGVSGAVGVLFAYFQGSSWIPLPVWAFALLVAGLYFLMWQIDTNYLIPRIIGSRLQLPPAVIIVGIIAGASVGGALGILLAAPTIATVRVLGSYIYRRLLDIEPYVIVYEKPAIGQPNGEPQKPKSVVTGDQPE